LYNNLNNASADLDKLLIDILPVRDPDEIYILSPLPAISIALCTEFILSLTYILFDVNEIVAGLIHAPPSFVDDNN
jgi:hypothetical protein